MTGPGEEFGDRLLAEIEDEARRRRESGEVPPDLERDLDRLFEALVPDSGGERDFASALERAERDALIDIDPPTDSERAALEPVKRGVKKLVLWYMDYVVGQVVAMGGSVVRAVRLLGERVDEVERKVEGLAQRQERQWRVSLDPAAAARPAPAGPDPLDVWREHVVAALSGAAGRVLHAEARDDALTARLVESGVDAYAVGPSRGTGDARTAGVIGHLETVAPGALGGAVLSDVVDAQALAEQVETVRLVAGALAAGGRLCIVGNGPEAWAASRPATEVDLAPGRPLHPETWVLLLRSAGFSDLAVEQASGDAASFLVTAVR